MPRYMEDYDIDTLDYCRYYFKPCKDVNVKYCDFKQLKHKEQALDEIENIIKGYCKNMCMSGTKETCESCQNTEILNIINKAKGETDEES